MSLPATALRMLGAIAVAGAAGWALMRLFDEGLSRLEKVAWSFAVGLVTQCGIYLFWRSLDPGVGWGRILLADGVLAGCSLVVRRARGDFSLGSVREKGGWPRPSIWLLALVAAAGWSVFLVQALSEPMWATDFLAIWGLKGKVIFQTPQWAERLFSDAGLFWSHREYPLLVPVSLATFAAMIGGWADQALALLWPACELATILTVAGFVGRHASGFAGAGAAALVALCFPLFQAVNVGTAEVPLAFALTLVGCALLDVMESGSAARLARLAAASVFCVSTKQEGTLFVVLSALVLTTRHRRMPGRKWAGAGLALLAPAAAHWVLLRLVTGPQSRRDFDFTLLAPGRWSELAVRMETVLRRFVETEARTALIPLLAIAAFLLVTRRGVGDVLWPIFAVQLACYAVAFSISAYDPAYAFDAAFRRLAVALFPAFLLILCTRGVGIEGADVIQTGSPPSVRPPKPEGSAA